VLSGSSRPETKTEALRLGADDFLSKPFDRTELLARMQAIVRRCRGFSNAVLRAGSLELNLGSREVTFHGRSVSLTGKEFAILELMVLREGSIISKEAFLNHLYGGMDEPELKIIDVFICKLRKKLANASEGRNFIETVWGRGYVLREPHDVEERIPA
jgi:two-component system, cell cycle response regulator CtrA